MTGMANTPVAHRPIPQGLRLARTVSSVVGRGSAARATSAPRTAASPSRRSRTTTSVFASRGLRFSAVFP